MHELFDLQICYYFLPVKITDESIEISLETEEIWEITRFRYYKYIKTKDPMARLKIENNRLKKENQKLKEEYQGLRKLLSELSVQAQLKKAKN